MSEMIERVAKAMIPVFCDNGMPISSPDEGTLDDVEMERWNALVEAARAAIQELRDPTNGMVTEAWMLSGDSSPTEYWRAMIDEALR